MHQRLPARPWLFMAALIAFTEFLQGEIDKWVKVVQVPGATMD